MSDNVIHCMREHIHCPWCGKRLKWGRNYYKVKTTNEVIPSDKNYFCCKDCATEFVNSEVIVANVLY